MKKISEKRFQEACDLYEGFCETCQDFTRGETEPDAENYECPSCGYDDVCGAEQAQLKGLIGIE